MWVKFYVSRTFFQSLFRKSSLYLSYIYKKYQDYDRNNSNRKETSIREKLIKAATEGKKVYYSDLIEDDVFYCVVFWYYLGSMLLY